MFSASQARIIMYVKITIENLNDRQRTQSIMLARTYSKHTQQVAHLLGQRVRLGRRSRRMSELELAARCGISRSTVRAIEAGSLKVEIGLFLEAAVIVGVTLFTDDPLELAAQLQRVDDRIALLPSRIYKKEEIPNDDF